jgi:pyruvate-formate lyase-activating enzyme
MATIPSTQDTRPTLFVVHLPGAPIPCPWCGKRQRLAIRRPSGQLVCPCRERGLH